MASFNKAEWPPQFYVVTWSIMPWKLYWCWFFIFNQCKVNCKGHIGQNASHQIKSLYHSLRHSTIWVGRYRQQQTFSQVKSISNKQVWIFTFSFIYNRLKTLITIWQKVFKYVSLECIQKTKHKIPAQKCQGQFFFKIIKSYVKDWHTVMRNNTFGLMV